jgi:TonB family protein
VALALSGAVAFASQAAADSVAHMRLEAEPTDMVAALSQAGLSVSPAGEVELNCATGPDGALRDCTVLSETPAGSRLGAAALALAPNYRASAPGAVRVTIPFRPYEATRWLARPSARELGEALQAANVDDRVGKAVLNCSSGPEDRLIACHVISSTPDERFGKAAMLAARYFRIRAATYNGRQVVSRIVLPITFNGSR